MKKSLIITVTTICVLNLSAKAQDGISQLLKSAPGDANKLLNAYADPLFKGFGTGLNNGWTNTAKTKGLLRFDLRISASGVFVPTADKSFDVTKIGLSSNTRLKAGSPAFTPTIGGEKGATPATLELYSDNGLKVDEFTLPKRVTPVVPAPQLQLTVGLIKHTDVTLRFIPKTKLSDNVGSVGMVGFGLKHNIMEDIFGGVGGKLVPFDLALAAGYTRFNYMLPLEVRPSGNRLPEPASAGKTDFSNQRLEGHFNGFNLQALFSKKLSVFTPFAAVGYNTAKTNVGLLGNFPVTSGLATYTVYTDPISINKTSINDVKVDVGFQLQLGFFNFYTSGSLAKYKSVNAGIGFGW
ncbi:DUF6588 family protein [uncultured Mucilaginibacter sp.]|uniref:DUF6588 family protein n=1 Tax=uncultured Mucilaginibacter sp. TaxID=797541 RepID=UPI0025CBB953|nr:DUF6588 family protein [uncultured Mucilaginibacter sp.]